MELKRYVLFNDKMIYKFNKESGLYHFDNNFNICISGSYVREDLVIKTSDNILDLVEIGDLVEQDFKGDNYIQRIDVESDLAKIKEDIECGYSNYYPCIYKRQPNGDYKRYQNDLRTI